MKKGTTPLDQELIDKLEEGEIPFKEFKLEEPKRDSSNPQDVSDELADFFATTKRRKLNFNQIWGPNFDTKSRNSSLGVKESKNDSQKEE